MNKKPVERKPRPKKREENSFSATSTNTLVNNPKDVSNLISFYETFKCKNKLQKDLVNLINGKDIVIASGPAGVGKSYVTIARALELVKANNTVYEKIIISTPAVEAEEEYGFIPGTVREKMEPYIASTLDVIDELIGKTNRLKMEELGFLIIQPLGYIRGKSIKKTILIMEEAQNMSPRQMKTLLTRIGEGSKFIISGDLEQSDKYDDIKKSGLFDAIQKHKNIPEIGFIEFSEGEIVRHPIIGKILLNYKIKPKLLVPPDRPTPPPTKIIIQPKKKTGFLSRFFNFLFLNNT
jgi:phosphate starvation-inducible protein PhoH